MVLKVFLDFIFKSYDTFDTVYSFWLFLVFIGMEFTKFIDMPRKKEEIFVMRVFWP